MDRYAEEKTGTGEEREVKERKSGQCLSAQTVGGAMGSAHHLKSSETKQERPKASHLASGSGCDPPIRTTKKQTKKRVMLAQK